MKPSDLNSYFERLAKEKLGHDPEHKESAFAIIDDPYDFEEFDNSLRNMAVFPAMLVEQNDGYLSGNLSSNYTNTLRTTFFVIDKRRGGEKIRDIRNRCFDLGWDIITHIRKDQPNNIVAGKRVYFEIKSAYLPVGPMEKNFYGYQFEVEFIAPVSF